MNTITPSPGVSEGRRSTVLRFGLLALCAFDAGLQLIAWLARSPFQGIGVVAFPLLQVIGLYYLALLAAIVGGIPLAIACFVTRRRPMIATGVALVVLSAVNALAVYAWYAGLETQRRERTRTEEAQARRAARCTEEIDRVLVAARADFAVPRKVIALGPHTSLDLDNGVRIALPFQLPGEGFRAFYYERLFGTPVRIVLHEDTPGWRERLCAMRVPYEGQSRDPGAVREEDPGASDTRRRRRRDAQAAPIVELPGDVYVDEKRIDATSDLDRDFPLPAPRGGIAKATAIVARFVDPRTGDRTYATGRAAPPGYTAEGRVFRLSATAFDGSRALYLCNAPFERPASAEHFLSTDSACEGREVVRPLGHVGVARDARTPRALLRCLRTVQSPLLTKTRHLVTSDVRECNGGIGVEAVLGFVE
jgi:hypothetical protein